MSRTAQLGLEKESTAAILPADIIGLRRVAEPRPMSLLSNRFFLQGVTKVSGTLEMFNEKMLPYFPMRREMLAQQFALFVNWRRRKVDMKLFGLEEHGRSLSFNLLFAAKYGNKCKYIALKGIGMPKRSYKGDAHRGTMRRNDWYNADWGLANYLNVRADWEMSNHFLKNRIRTSVPIAVIKLNTALLKTGKELSIKKLEKRGTIKRRIRYREGRGSERQQPVIELVGYSEMMRILDARKSDYLKFATEHGLALEQYSGWWIERVAKNAARMHDLGIRHNYITDHNITLDGCIVDNDGSEPMKKGVGIVPDLRGIFEVADDLPEHIGVSKTDLRLRFFRMYLKSRRKLDEEQWGKILYLATRLGDWRVQSKQVLDYVLRSLGKDEALTKTAKRRLIKTSKRP